MTVDNNNSNVWNATHFSVQYRTPLSQFEDKSVQHCIVCNAVWQCDCVKPMRIGLIKTLRKKKKKKKKKNKQTNKQKQNKAVWCTETPSRRSQGKPAPHGERRVTLDTMLK